MQVTNRRNDRKNIVLRQYRAESRLGTHRKLEIAINTMGDAFAQQDC
jgi:hypothetical protein